MNGTIKVETPISELSSIEYTEGQTIAGYCASLALPPSVPVVCLLNGSPTLRSEWGRPLAPGDDLRFVAMPRGSAIGNLLGSVAVAAVGFAIGGPLVALGAFVVSNALLNVLAPPQIGKGPEQPSPTYSIGAQGNSARLLQPIPKGYGLHNIYPDFASQPYTTYNGNDQILYQLFCLGLGEYEVQQVRIGETVAWRSDTGYTDSFEDVTIEIIPPGAPVTLFPAAVQTSEQVGGADLVPGTALGPFVANTSNTLTNELQVDFVFPRGLYDANKKGKLQSRTVTLNVEARKIDNAGLPVGSWTVLGAPSYSRATSTAQRFTESYPVELGRYQVRVTRITPLADDDDTSIADQTQWAGLRAFEPSDNTYENVTLLAVKIKASNQLSQKSSTLFNVIQISKLPIWNGSSWSAPQATRSIAWAAADMLRNPIYGEGRSASAIDLNKLRQLDILWASRGDTFNGVFDTKRTFWEALALVLAAGRTQPLIIGGVVTFMRDQPRTIAKGMFTPANIVAGSFETNHVLYNESTPDDIIVEYQDERTWKMNEVECSLDGSSSDNPARIQLFGVTSYAQAWREGIYQAAANNYRRINGSLKTELEGKLITRGDGAIVSHDMPKWGTSGEVEEYDAAARKVYLSEPCDWTTGPFYMNFADRRNRQWGPVLVTRGAEDDEAVFDENSLNLVQNEMGEFEDIVVTDPNYVITKFVHGNALKVARRFIVTGTEPEGRETQLALINDDPRVYLADQGSPPVEPETGQGPGQADAGPALAGLHVSLDPSSEASPITVNASWQPSPGANYYVAQLSYDGYSYDTLYEGANTSISFVAQPNLITVRVAAVGVIRGPWAYQSKEYSQSLVTSPTELSLEKSTPPKITVRTPVDNSWSYVRLYRNSTGAITGAVKVGDDIIGGLGQYFTIEDSNAGTGTNYYFARAFDSAGNFSSLAGPVS